MNLETKHVQGLNTRKWSSYSQIDPLDHKLHSAMYSHVLWATSSQVGPGIQSGKTEDIRHT